MFLILILNSRTTHMKQLNLFPHFHWKTTGINVSRLAITVGISTVFVQGAQEPSETMFQSPLTELQSGQLY